MLDQCSCFLLHSNSLLYQLHYHHHYKILLGTHDAQNITVSSPRPGEIRITGNFIDGATATGLLVIVYSLTNGSDVYYHGHTIGEDEQVFDTVIEDLAGGDYGVSVFVIEENGLPFERVVTRPKVVSVSTISGKVALYNIYCI